MCNDAPSSDFVYAEFFDQVFDCMESTTGFECANLLVVFAFEEQSESRSGCTWLRWGRRYAIKCRRCKDWRAVDVRLDGSVGLFDGLWSKWQTVLRICHCN
jgi:hypothetical protein